MKIIFIINNKVNGMMIKEMDKGNSLNKNGDTYEGI